MNGFASPNYTQTPNDLFDELLPNMGLAELKVVMCIVRHTFGYHKEEVRLSIRTIARFTGLTANSVMDGAKQAEEHGLIERHLDGNKTTTWTAIVSVVPTKTPRLTSRDASVSLTETLLGDKERKEIKKKEKKGDLVDAMLFYGKQSRRDDAVNELFDKLERELKVNLQRSNSNQVIVRKILKADADGEKVDTFLAWLKSDEWRLAHLYIYTDLSKLWQMYPQAFANEPSTSRPEYPPIRDLSIGAVPNPFQKPKSLPRTGREQS